MQKYRNKADGKIVEAFRYGEGKPWDNHALTKVAKFITGIDVDSHTVVSNERILDVVQPILAEWNADKGLFPITVASYRIDYGDWVIRFVDRSIGYSIHTAFMRDYELVYDSLEHGRYMSNEELEIEELADFLYNECFDGLDGELYQALAEGAAPKIVKAGWRKVKK